MKFTQLLKLPTIFFGGKIGFLWKDQPISDLPKLTNKGLIYWPADFIGAPLILTPYSTLYLVPFTPSNKML